MSLKDTLVRDTPSYIIEPMLSVIYHCFEYKPMGLYSRGLIFEWFFCRQIIGLIFEGAYNRGGLYSRFYGIHLNLIRVHSIWEFRDIRFEYANTVKSRV